MTRLSNSSDTAVDYDVLLQQANLARVFGERDAGQHPTAIPDLNGLK